MKTGAAEWPFVCAFCMRSAQVPTRLRLLCVLHCMFLPVKGHDQLKLYVSMQVCVLHHSTAYKTACLRSTAEGEWVSQAKVWLAVVDLSSTLGLCFSHCSSSSSSRGSRASSF
jgi:hypothetical protein